MSKRIEVIGQLHDKQAEMLRSVFFALSNDNHCIYKNPHAKTWMKLYEGEYNDFLSQHSTKQFKMELVYDN